MDNSKVEKICSGCDVKEPWEHRCHGENCNCDDPVCMEIQGKITHEELMEIIRKDTGSI